MTNKRRSLQGNAEMPKRRGKTTLKLPVPDVSEPLHATNDVKVSQ